MMNKQIITEAEIPEIVARFERGEFVSIIFTKADGTRRTALAQFGVANPTNTAKPNGTGESAAAIGRRFFRAFSRSRATARRTSSITLQRQSHKKEKELHK